MRDRAAHAGGVDEADRPGVGLDHRVDRVAGRAGHVVHDGTLLTDQPVEQRRLADVGPPDQGDRDDPRSSPRRACGRLRVLDRSGRSGPRVGRRRGSGGPTTASSRSPVPRPCSAETGIRIAEAEAQQLPDTSASWRASSTLLATTQHRRLAGPQHAGDTGVVVGHTDGRVDHEQDHIAPRGAPPPTAGVTLRSSSAARRRASRRCRPATNVTPRHSRGDLLAVAGHARALLDDRVRGGR